MARRPKIRRMPGGRVRLAQLKPSIAHNLKEAWDLSRLGDNWDAEVKMGRMYRQRVNAWEYTMEAGQTWVELGSTTAFQVLAGDRNAWAALEDSRENYYLDAGTLDPDHPLYETLLAKQLDLVHEARKLIVEKFGEWVVA